MPTDFPVWTGYLNVLKVLVSSWTKPRWVGSGVGSGDGWGEEELGWEMKTTVLE